LEPFNFETAKELIIEQAKRLVNKFIETRGHDIPPFSPEEIAKLVGVSRIEKADLGKANGLLIKVFKYSIIKINKNDIQVRQNFSCAHEIGHILVNELRLDKYVSTVEHRTFDPQAQKRNSSKLIEKLCDDVATELLMPQLVYGKYLSEMGLSINSIEKLARLFNVSIQAAAIRASELNTSPSIILKWQRKINNPNNLTLSWPKQKLIKGVLYSPKTKVVSPPSTLHRAFFNKELHGDTYKCFMSFKIGKEEKRLPLESKGFGSGNNRYLISLAYIN
jgi:Zn-dependent peptidase ImmA (M78 family)